MCKTEFLKYPRTHHLAGSALQSGDQDLGQIPFADIQGRYIVVEEKIDGANCGISFLSQEYLLLQSRGHELGGGPRERQFDIFKSWANAHKSALWDLLGTRYIMYGEWMHAKHSVFYDQLPHWFMEFDIFDKEGNFFLSTNRRHEMLGCCSGVNIEPVATLGEGTSFDAKGLIELLDKSVYKSVDWRDNLAQAAAAAGLDSAQVEQQTDMSDLAEGLYIKVEQGDRTIVRLKWVRRSFVSLIQDSDEHWMNRPIVANKLREDADIWVC